jgi:hypothetical protein
LLAARTVAAITGRREIPSRLFVPLVPIDRPAPPPLSPLSRRSEKWLSRLAADLNVPGYYADMVRCGRVVEIADHPAHHLEAIHPEEASAARVLREWVKNQGWGENQSLAGKLRSIVIKDFWFTRSSKPVTSPF